MLVKNKSAGPPTKHSWREPFYKVMVQACSVGGIPVSIVLLGVIQLNATQGFLDWLPCYLAFAVVLLLNIPVVSKLSYRVRSGTFLLCMHFISWVALSLLGIETGPVVVAFLCTLAVGLLWERRWIALSLTLNSGLVGYVRTTVEPAEIPGVLTAAVFGGTTLVGVILILFVVKSLESQVQRGIDDLVALRKEQEQREAAEEALLKVRGQLEDVRKFEALGRVAGGVAHEFNNLLQIIIAWTQELPSANSVEERTEMIGYIEEATRLAGDITSDMLTVARRGSHVMELVDLAESVRRWSASWEHILPKGVELDIVAQPVGCVVANKGALRQALLNLIKNASDPAVGATKISVELFSDASSERAIQIVVSDNGKGMEEEVLRRAFEPFYTTKRGSGTGLGLAIVRGTIEQFGGKIELESEVGVGSRVKISLAASEEQRTPDVVPSVAVQKMHRRVLVVEDEPALLEVMGHMLHRLKHDYELAPNGDVAMQILLQEDPFDVLCLDANIPGISSIEIAEHYRVQCPSGTLIICTGDIGNDDLLEFANQHTIPILNKPFTTNELETVMY